MKISLLVRVIAIGLIIVPSTLGLTIHVARAAAPDTFIDSSPDAVTISTTAVFEFQANEEPATFECSVTAGDESPTYASCVSPYTVSDLELGEYTFHVRATNAGEETDLSPAVYTWTVAPFSGGDGSEETPFQISTCEALNAMSLDLDATYELIDDVNCFGFSYTPVGSFEEPFTGTLNGNGFSVRFLTVTGASTFGIFSFSEGATIQDLGIKYGSFEGEGSGGALVGYADLGTYITRIRVSDTDVVSSNGYVGGITGFLGNESIMTLSSFVGGSVSSPGHVYVGGLTGTLASASMDNSFSRTTLNGNQAGGLAGTVVGSEEITTIDKSYSASTFSALGTSNGGLVGLFEEGTISNSFSASDMRVGGGSSIGAMFGQMGMGTSENNYFDRTRAGRANCAGTGDATCTAVNVNNALPAYFKNNSTHAPLDTWSFGPESLWHVNADDYPTLTPIYGPTIICQAPNQTLTAIQGSCDYTEQGWGTATWEAEYQIAGADEWTPIALEDDRVGDATVEGTSPYSDYNMRFRFTNDYGISFWATVEFVNSDSDSDGTNDLIESLGPNDGDANHDGTADRDQANVTTLLNPVSDTYVVLKTACDNNFNVQIGAESDDPTDETFTYPAGLIGFVGRDCGEAGVTVPVTMYFYGDLNPEDLVLRKSTDDGYVTIEDAVLTSVTNDGEKAVKVEYDVVDGGSLDQDGEADGNIVDPVGLADSTIDAPDTGLPSRSLSVSLILMVFGLSSALYLTRKVVLETSFNAKGK